MGRTTTLIHAADLHIRNPSTSKRPNVRDDSIYSLNQIVDLCQPADVDGLLLAGDIFHSRFPSDEEVLAFADALRRVPERCRVIIVCGNHDPSAVGGWQSIARLPNVVNPTGLKLIEIGNARVHGFDFVGRDGLFDRFLQIPENANVVVLHQQPEEAGGELVPGEFSLHTDLPAAACPRYWAAGNYHVPFEWRSPGEPPQVWMFPGSTWSVAINEPQDKSVVRLTVHENGALEWRREPLKTRRIFRVALRDEAEYQHFLTSRLPEFKALAEAYEPAGSPIRSPLIDVLHAPIPDLRERVVDACKDWAHLFLTPTDFQTAVNPLALTESDEQPTSLTQLINEVMGDRPDADTAALVADLWQSPDPEATLAAWADRQPR